MNGCSGGWDSSIRRKTKRKPQYSPRWPLTASFQSHLRVQGAVILHLSWEARFSGDSSEDGGGGGRPRRVEGGTGAGGGGRGVLAEGRHTSGGQIGTSSWAFASWNGGLSEPGRWAANRHALSTCAHRRFVCPLFAVPCTE